MQETKLISPKNIENDAMQNSNAFQVLRENYRVKAKKTVNLIQSETESFYQFFANIGHQLAEKIQPSQKHHQK